MQRPCGYSESGYTLVGLMVLVAVINVSLAVAVTSTRTLGRRAHEAELIWRGQQIERAIGCYEQANAGQLLTRLEQLVETDCLRRVYRDPMVSDGRWRILYQQDVADGTVATLLGVEVGTGGAKGALASSIGLADTGPISSASRAAPSLASSSATSENAIVGVVSRSVETSLRFYSNRTKYSQWIFLGGQAAAASTAVPSRAQAASVQGLTLQR